MKLSQMILAERDRSRFHFARSFNMVAPTPITAPTRVLSNVNQFMAIEDRGSPSLGGWPRS